MSLLDYGPLLRAQDPRILLVIVSGTLLVMMSTALAVEWVCRRHGHPGGLSMCCRSGLALAHAVGLCATLFTCIADSAASGWLTDCAGAAAAVLLGHPNNTHYADYAHDAPVGW